MISKYAQAGFRLLNSPLKILWICLAFCFVSVVMDGSFIRLWSLHREASELEVKIEVAKEQAKHLEFKIQEAQQPAFIERQARDQLDLVKDGDLVFVFTEDSTVAAQ